MATEQALSGVLSGLSSEDQAELAAYTQRMRDLKKKVGTQRALQIVGSAMAVGAGKPSLIPALTPKFGLTPDEIAARKKGLREERYGLMEGQEKAREFILNLKAEIGKGRISQQNALASAVKGIYTAAMGNASAQQIARGRLRGEGAEDKEKQAGAIKVMASATDPVHGPAVGEALNAVQNKLNKIGGLTERPDAPGHLSPETWDAINAEAAKLKVPGQKEIFYEQVFSPLVNKDKIIDRLKTGETTGVMPTSNQEKAASDMLKESQKAADLAYREKKKLTDAAMEDRLAAVRMMGTSRFDPVLMDKVTAAVKGFGGAQGPTEADNILKSLIADFETPTKMDESRKNEIENLKKMEAAYDKNLGTKPVQEMYRRMERSPAVKKVQQQLANADYHLTERDVVKLILRNSRQQLRAKEGKSAKHFGLLNQILRAGGNILSKDLPPKEEAEITVGEEVTAEAPAEEGKMAALKGKVGEGVKAALPDIDKLTTDYDPKVWKSDAAITNEAAKEANKSATLVNASDPLGQLGKTKGETDPDYFDPPNPPEAPLKFAR